MQNDDENTMYIWGEDFSGFRIREPQVFTKFKHQIKQVCFGKKHGLAIDDRDVLYGWGDGTYGELGDESLRMSDEPLKIGYFNNKDIKAKRIAAGDRHSIVMSDDGSIFCFGDNSS